MIPKPPILNEEQMGHTPQIDPAVKLIAIANREAQRDHSYQKMLEWFIEWGNEPCLHTVIYGSRIKRACDKCWSELQKEVEDGQPTN